MADVFAGYRGLVDIAAVGQVRFADASITARQTVEIPDLIMGDVDHDAYVYGKIEVGGSISGPVTETFISGSGGGGLWDWGAKRYGDCLTMEDNDVDVYYYCGGSNNRHRQFTGMYVNTLGFSCAAGDIAQFNMDLMGKSAGDWDQNDPPLFTTAEKLITWDKVTISIVVGDESFTVPSNIQYSNFDLTISNNLQPVYTLGQNDTVGLFPFEIVPGLRTVNGSISVYNTPQADGVDKWDDYVAANFGTITFNIATLTITMNARFHRVEPASSVGPIVSTIGFTSVGALTGAEWRG